MAVGKVNDPLLPMARFSVLLCEPLPACNCKARPEPERPLTTPPTVNWSVVQTTAMSLIVWETVPWPFPMVQVCLGDSGWMSTATS